MSIREKIEPDLKAAMLARDAVKTGALRMIKSAMKNKEVEKSAGYVLNDAECLQLLSSMKKQREESISEFTKANRMDLVDKEKAELAIIQSYLPEAMSESEIQAIIADAIKEAGAVTAKDMGKVMKIVTAKTTGRADGKLVSGWVKTALEALPK